MTSDSATQKLDNIVATFVGSGEGKWGGWCRTCGGDGIDPEEQR